MTESERIAGLTARLRAGGEGAEEAFEALYSTYGKRVYYFCHCLLREEDAAVDATRSIFLYAWRSQRSIPEEQSFYHWICGNAFYFAKIALAGIRGNSVTVDEVEGDPSLFDGMNRPNPQNAAEINVRRSHLDTVTEGLRVLPDADRICVLLYDYARFPVEEVAGMVGCSVQTVKCRVYRGHEALCEALERANPGDGELFAPYLDKLLRTCGKNFDLPERVTERIREGIADGESVEFPLPNVEDVKPPKSGGMSPVVINRICILLGVLFAGALTYILYWFLSSPKTPTTDLSSTPSEGYVSQVISADTPSDDLSEPGTTPSGDASGSVSTPSVSTPDASTPDVSDPTVSSDVSGTVSGTVSGSVSTPTVSTPETSTPEVSQPTEPGELPRTTTRLRLREQPSTSGGVVTTIPEGAHIDLLDPEPVTAEDGTLWYHARYTASAGLWFDGYCSAEFVQTTE